MGLTNTFEAVLCVPLCLLRALCGLRNSKMLADVNFAPMPLFEYACRDCDKRFTWMSGVVADEKTPRCPACRSADLRKLISRVTRGRSDDARMEGIADKLENQDFDDARQLRRFAREMGREMGAETGEDLSDEMEEIIEAEANGDGDMGRGGGTDDTIY